MNLSLTQRQLIQAIVSCVVIFIVAAYAAFRYAGDFKATILGTISTILAPTIGALVTLLFVTPIKNEMSRSTAVLERVEKKVNGQMDSLRKSAEEANRKATDAIANCARVTADALAAAQEAKQRESVSALELQRLHERLRQIQGESGSSA